MILTGCGCRCDAPAPGLVLITTPAGIVADSWLATLPGVSPAWRSAASAAASGWPLTCGTAIIRGPADGISSTMPPLCTRAPAAGTVAITSPLARPLSSRAVPVLTVKPAPRSSARAAVTVSRATRGTCAYRPASCHQASPPISPAARTASTR